MDQYLDNVTRGTFGNGPFVYPKPEVIERRLASDDQASKAETAERSTRRTTAGTGSMGLTTNDGLGGERGGKPSGRYVSFAHSWASMPHRLHILVPPSS